MFEVALARPLPAAAVARLLEWCLVHLDGRVFVSAGDAAGGGQPQGGALVLSRPGALVAAEELVPCPLERMADSCEAIAEGDALAQVVASLFFRSREDAASVARIVNNEHGQETAAVVPFPA